LVLKFNQWFGSFNNIVIVNTFKMRYYSVNNGAVDLELRVII